MKNTPVFNVDPRIREHMQNTDLALGYINVNWLFKMAAPTAACFADAIFKVMADYDVKRTLKSKQQESPENASQNLKCPPYVLSQLGTRRTERRHSPEYLNLPAAEIGVARGQWLTDSLARWELSTPHYNLCVEIVKSPL